MKILIWGFIFMFLSGFISFSLKHKHLLSMLLSLECLTLSVYGLMYFSFLSFNSLSFLNLVYLTFGVCEGVMGLSVMVSLIRTHGNDYFQSFSLLW